MTTSLRDEAPSPNASRCAEVSPGAIREPDLVKRLEPIRQAYRAVAIEAMFASGLFDLLADTSVSVEDAANRLGLDEERLEALAYYLANEGLVVVSGNLLHLTGEARGLGQYRPWYELMIGGYLPTLAALDETLERGSPPAPRDAAKVGRGSCGISAHDAFLMVAELMQSEPIAAPRVLDIGCGSGECLTDICTRFPDAVGFGIEAAPDGARAARAQVGRSGLSSRIRILEQAPDDVLSSLDEPLDVAIAAFVLHEILGQEGPDGVSRLLRSLVCLGVRLVIVIEVDDRHRDAQAMQRGLAKAFWNPYFLLHPMTGQRLATESIWDQLFDDAGLVTVTKTRAPEAIDSSGFCVGWLLTGDDNTCVVNEG